MRPASWSRQGSGGRRVDRRQAGDGALGTGSPVGGRYLATFAHRQRGPGCGEIRRAVASEPQPAREDARRGKTRDLGLGAGLVWGL